MAEQMNSDFSDARLQKKLRKIGAVFDIDQVAGLRTDTEYVKRYYQVNKIPYTLFHTTTNFLHMGVSASKRFKSSDLEYQTKEVEILASTKRAEQILELAGGRGANSAWLARRRPEWKYVVTDISETQIQFAKKVEQKYPNIAARLLDFHDLGMFENSTFDFVFIIEALCYANDLEQVLSEVYRVLRPGGTFLVFDGYRERPEQELTKDEAVAALMLERGMAVSQFKYYSDFRIAATKAGFSVECERNLTDFVIPTMMRFELLAKFYFRFPTIARGVAKVLPEEFLYNAVSGYLFPIMMHRKAFSYWQSSLVK